VLEAQEKKSTKEYYEKLKHLLHPLLTAIGSIGQEVAQTPGILYLFDKH